MPIAIALNSKLLAKILSDDINELSGPISRASGHIETECVIGEFDGMQVSIKVSRDDDEFGELSKKNECVTKVEITKAKGKGK